jgi:hypothetical protein
VHKQLLVACVLLFPMLLYVNRAGNTAAMLAVLGLYCSINTVLAYAAPLSSIVSSSLKPISLYITTCAGG